MSIPEAQPLRFTYQQIKNLADSFKSNSLLKIEDLENVLTRLGFIVKEVSAVDFEKINDFLCVNSSSSIEIKVIEGHNLLRRLILGQALGHYILHSQSGEKKCKVSHMSKSPASLEGLYFSLALLIDDNLLKDMLKEGLSNKKISNIFNVPEKMVEIKKIVMEVDYGK